MSANKFLAHRAKHRSKKSASQGMTAAIILIAFIITAAGIAFVILTMGSNMQMNLDTIGQSGTEASSSAMEVQSGFIVGWSTASSENITGYSFLAKMTLDTGLVDLGDDAIELSIVVGSNTEQNLANNATLTSTDDLLVANDNVYGKYFYNNDTDEILEPGETVMFMIKTSDALGAVANTKVTIIIVTGVAMIRIEKTMPTGIEDDTNLLK
jgi:flagellin FlaB